MDNRTFLSRIAKKLEIEPKETAQLTIALNNIIGECIAENNNVAMPGFGTFEAIKTEDHIETNPETGKRILVPPSIIVNFKPGSRLKKAAAKL